MGAAQSSSAAYVPSVSGFGRIGLLLSDVKPSDADDDEVCNLLASHLTISFIGHVAHVSLMLSGIEHVSEYAEQH